MKAMKFPSHISIYSLAHWIEFHVSMTQWPSNTVNIYLRIGIAYRTRPLACKWVTLRHIIRCLNMHGQKNSTAPHRFEIRSNVFLLYYTLIAIATSMSWNSNGKSHDDEKHWKRKSFSCATSVYSGYAAVFVFFARCVSAWSKTFFCC